MATITCTRCGRSTEALPEPPMGGTLGQTIQSQICPDCWQEWLAQQVLYINHYGLQLADPEDRKQLIQVMKDFLGLSPT